MSAEPTPRLDQALAHAHFLRAVARGVLGGDAEVDDVLQETFVVASRESPRNPGALRAWLGTIARRLALDRRRSTARRALRETAAARPEGLPSTSEIAAREETRRLLVAAVLALEEPYRTTVLWRYYAARSVAEIAELQAVPVATVRTRLHRGLAHLRERLDAGHEGGRRAWTIALAPLAWPRAIVATAAAAGVVAGGIAVKKIAVAALVLLLAAGGYAVATRPAARDATPSESPPLAATGDRDSARGAVQDPVAGLSGSGARRGAPPAIAKQPPQPFQAVVVDPAGRPVAGAAVWARTYFADVTARVATLRADFGDSAATTKTDADGRFGFTPPPMPWLKDVKGVEVRIAADGFALQIATVLRGVEGRIALSHGGLLSLRVVDEAGRQADGASLLVCEGEGRIDASRDGALSVAAEELTKAGGRFSTRLPPGPYRVRAFAPGLRPLDTDVLRVENGGTTERTIRLDAGIVAEFHVVAESGEPLAGATVRALGPLGSGGSATTDADGRCRVAGIAPAPRESGQSSSLGRTDQLLYAVEGAGFASLLGSRIVPPERQAVSIEVRLERGVAVRVRLVDGGGAPVPDPSAYWVPLPPTYSPLEPHSAALAVAPDGSIEMPRVRPGAWRIAASSASDPRYEAISKDVDVRPEDQEVLIVLPRLDGIVVGTVLLPDGSPAREGTVSFEPEELPGTTRASFPSTALDAEGRFRLMSVRTGKGAVLATTPGRSTQRFPVEVASGDAGEPVTLRLRPGLPISGRVVERGGAPVPDVLVKLWRDVEREDHGLHSVQSVEQASTRSGPDGAFFLTAEAAPALHLWIQSQTWCVMQGGSDAVKAGTEGIVLRVKPASEGWGMPLHVRPTSGGRPYEGKLDVTWRVDGGLRIAGEWTPDANGGRQYAFWGRAGTYDLTLQAPSHRPTIVRGVAIEETAEGTTLDVALDRGAAVRLRLKDGDGRPLAKAWILANGQTLGTDDGGECDVWGWPPTTQPFDLGVALASDPTFTTAVAAGVTAPGSADVTLRRKALAYVRLGVPYATLESDVVLRLLDASGATVDERRISATKAREWSGQASSFLSAFADGTYRVTVEMGTKRGEAPVALRLGQQVEVSMLLR